MLNQISLTILFLALSKTSLPFRGARLPTLTTVAVPEGVDEAAIRRRLLEGYNIEIAGGLGAFKGKAWRIGLMGYSCRRENVILLLAALADILAEAD